jgi:PAS domain S-box-containing protein
LSKEPTYEALAERCKALEGEVERLRSEQPRLLEGEARFRTIAEHTGDLIAITTFSTEPVYTFISPSVEPFGFQLDDLIGKPALSYVHGDDREQIRLQLADMVAEKEKCQATGIPLRTSCKLIYRFLSPHGKWLHQECTVSNIDTSALLFISRDVSEQKRAEAALRASEAAYRSIFENTGTATLIIEEDTTICMANSEFARMVGYAKEEIEGIKKWPEFVVPEDTAFMKRYHRARRCGKTDVPDKYEFRLRDRYGNTRIVYNSVAVIPGTGQSISSMYDVTPVRKAEMALRESEEKFRTITSRAHDAIVMVTSNGRVSYCNLAAESMFGYTAAEMAGREIADMIGTHKTRGKVAAAFSLAGVANGTETTSGAVQELTARTQDGSLIQIELSVSVISIQGEKQVLGIIRDISERLRIAQQLQQSQKMEAMGTLASGIAHDFNNILGAIFGYCSLVKSKGAGNDKVVAYADEILHASHRAKKLIRNILTFTRQKRSRKETIEIDPLVQEAMELLRASIPSTIELVYLGCEDALPLEGNPTQIHQIIMNLATNAYHAIGDSGGRIGIQTANVDIDAETALADEDLNKGRYLRLSVTDTGTGIDRDIIDHIFEPYFTTKEVDVGTGMGLATVHGIVREHGGAITVQSTPGKGSTFHVYLPLTDHSSRRFETGIEEVHGGEEHILFVDDEQMLAQSAMLMLEDLGYKVTIKTDPVEAMVLLRTQPSEYDLIITDLTMPVMNGEELARKARETRKDIPIVLCSGFSKSLTEKELDEMGIDRILSKPIVIEELAETIRSVLDRR